MAKEVKEIKDADNFEIKFSKEQLVNSKRYSKYKDLLNTLLKDDEMYTIAEVDAIIENYHKKPTSKKENLKGRVK